jgi:hypothetical protein
MNLRRKKSRKSQIGELLGSYVKVKTASTAAKGAGKAAKGTGKAAKGTALAAKKTPVKRVPLIAAGTAAAAGAAAFVVAKARGGKDQPAGA